MSVSERLASMQPLDIGIPGPTSQEMARSFLSIRADPLSFLAEVAVRYGSTVAFPVPGAPVLLVNDPDDARHILQTRARDWEKKTVQYGALARLTGPGLLATSEPTWLQHRRTAAPAFHHQRLAAISDRVRAAADGAIAATFSRPGRAEDEPVDIAGFTHRASLDVVGRALFATDLSEHAQLLVEATSKAADLVVRLGRSVLPTAEWAPTPTSLRLRSTRRRLETITTDLIDDRRARTGAGGAAEDDDLLGLLLDSGLDDDQIRYELITMVVAGHETVAAAMSWTLMLLAEHPDVQQRVRAELVAAPRAVSLADSREARPFTRAVVDEALRLYPPAWVISRRTRREDTIAGVGVPAGTMAIISPWVMQRRPDLWPEPLEFRPERFLHETGRADGYLPFGQGPRLCIGRELALGEMVVMLARLLSTWRVELPPGWSRPRPDARLAVHPRGGMPLLVRRLAGDRGE